MADSIPFMVSTRLQQIAREVDRLLAEAAGDRQLFSLVVWTPGETQYVSNANRPDVAAAFEKLLAKWRAGAPDVPFHEKN